MGHYEMPATVAFIHHLSTPLRCCFFSLLSYSATRLRECIQRCMRHTAILKNNSTAEKRREEEAFALESIAHYCFVKTKSNCDACLKIKKMIVCRIINQLIVILRLFS